jgi:hypothetical protein
MHEEVKPAAHAAIRFVYPLDLGRLMGDPSGSFGLSHSKPLRHASFDKLRATGSIIFMPDQ